MNDDDVFSSELIQIATDGWHHPEIETMPRSPADLSALWKTRKVRHA
jgi:hypothetical protein